MYVGLEKVDDDYYYFPSQQVFATRKVSERLEVRNIILIHQTVKRRLAG